LPEFTVIRITLGDRYTQNAIETISPNAHECNASIAVSFVYLRGVAVLTIEMLTNCYASALPHRVEALNDDARLTSV